MPSVFRAGQRLFGALQVDLFCTLGGFRKNGGTVRKDLSKSRIIAM